MPTPNRDPAEVAKTIKLMREMLGMKAETLAELSGLNIRSIERAESGRHLPSEQSLAQIARAFGCSLALFDSVTIDDKTFRKQIEETAKKTVMVEMAAMEHPAEVMAFMDGGLAYQHDMSAIREAAALDAATALVEMFIDVGEGWDDISLSDRLNYARYLIDQAGKLLVLGYKTQMGTYRARHLSAKNLKFSVKLITFLPNDHPGKYAMVTLPDHMETLPEDRIKLPDSDEVVG